MSAFRLCVDLNVWVSSFIAEAKGRQGTAAQAIVRAVQDGRAGLGPVQLVVSHTMLTRLHEVLTRRGASLDTASRFVTLIADFTMAGPAPELPRLVLGGGVTPTRDARMPVYDPYDPNVTPKRHDNEDGRVLDTAIAGNANALVTADFRDFEHYTDTVVVKGRIHLKQTARGSLVVIRPQDMAAWLRTGQSPIPSAPAAKDAPEHPCGTHGTA